MTVHYVDFGKERQKPNNNKISKTPSIFERKLPLLRVVSEKPDLLKRILDRGLQEKK